MVFSQGSRSFEHSDANASDESSSEGEESESESGLITEFWLNTVNPTRSTRPLDSIGAIMILVVQSQETELEDDPAEAEPAVPTNAEGWSIDLVFVQVLLSEKNGYFNLSPFTCQSPWQVMHLRMVPLWLSRMDQA